jgi:hypothetical protein
VVSDGGMAFLDPSTLPSVRDEVARVLRPTGSVVFRLYVWDTSQRLDEILAEVDRGTVETVNELRLRSWSALQNSLHEGVVVADAFHTVVERANGLRALRDRSGLPPDQFIPFTASAASAGRYTMWPLDQVTDIWCATGSFEPSGVHIPRCRLGTLSPVLRFERTTSLDST